MAYKIFIDQGHNPVNPNAGAEFAGVREQDVNFDVGIRLAELLEEDPLFEVRLSRPNPEDQLGTDNASSLRARADMANNWGADFFISLHCNTNSSTEISGTEAYVYRAESAGSRMGVQVVWGIHKATGLRNRGVFVRPSLAVLRWTKMPAVLVEMGFLTHTTDRNLLVCCPQLFAQGIYNGIKAYYYMQYGACR